MPANRKQIKPRRDAAAENAARWREAFVRYLRSECHLAENTVLAYDRDLRRFLEWLGNRRIEGLQSPTSPATRPGSRSRNSPPRASAGMWCR